MGRQITKFTPPDPPKNRRSSASRVRILRAAAELFLEYGYEAVSMNDVADRAELTKGGLYGHVRSKGQLLVEVIRAKYREFEESAAFRDALEDPKTAVGLLWTPAGRDVRLLVTDAAAAARHDPDVRAGMAALDADRAAAVGARMDGYISGGDVAAWLLLALASGIGMREAFGVEPPQPGALDPIVVRLIDALLD